jgi:hypothetical protein
LNHFKRKIWALYKIMSSICNDLKMSENVWEMSLWLIVPFLYTPFIQGLGQERHKMPGQRHGTSFLIAKAMIPEDQHFFGTCPEFHYPQGSTKRASWHSCPQGLAL